MNCDTCGTALTEFNATNYRHVHDVGNCTQVLLAQRDNARAALESDRALLRRIVDALNTWDATAPTVLNAPTSLFVRTVRSIIDEVRVRVGEGK